MYAQQLTEKINDKSARIAIIGLGYVGIPLAIRFCETGFDILGFDIDQERVDQLNNGKSPLAHLENERIQAINASGFEGTTDFTRIGEADAVIICVPTPLNKYREPDLSFITDTLETIRPHLRAGQMIALESTTYPGTTREVVLPYLEKQGFEAGKNMFLVYSPEREDPGNPNFETKTIPKVVGGFSETCLEIGAAVYGQVIDQVVSVSTLEAAELTKLLENIHRAVNIGLVNEMKIIADKMGINIYEVIDAAATKPFGFTAYYPGPGLGGHCIPVDPFYLTWKAREFGVHTRFIELAGDINRHMPDWVVGKISLAMNAQKKALHDSRILVLGIAYKKNVNDMRESPSVLVMEQLRELGAKLDYHDPFVPSFPKMREHCFDLASVALSPEAIKQYDCVVVLTDHSNVDYEMIQHNAKLIVDTRNVFKQKNDHIIPA